VTADERVGVVCERGGEVSEPIRGDGAIVVSECEILVLRLTCACVARLRRTRVRLRQQRQIKFKAKFIGEFRQGRCLVIVDDDDLEHLARVA
jgi:hypothetical protein